MGKRIGSRLLETALLALALLLLAGCTHGGGLPPLRY
jgi:hypothetical protein